MSFRGFSSHLVLPLCLQTRYSRNRTFLFHVPLVVLKSVQAKMFRRKLLALDYAQPDNFNVNNAAELGSLVVWLEDQKIRHMKIEDRAALRDTAGPEWSSAFQRYLAELNCPYAGGKKEVVVDWLLGYAVRLEYGDDAETFKSVTRATVDQAKRPGAPSSNPLDNLDFESAELKAGVTSLSMLLQVPPHPDHLEQLKAISLLISNTLSKEALQNASTSGDPTKDSEHIPLNKTELGFEAGDYILNDAAKIVRLLHLKELRDLQSKINAAIVAVQAVTADPKTDSRLGKVGR